MIWLPRRKVITPARRQAGFLLNPYRFETAAVPWTPSNLGTQPEGWFNDDSSITDAGGGVCSGWNDISGAGAHMGQPTSGARPTILSAELNGRRVIRFNGTSQFLYSETAGAAALFRNQQYGWIMACYKKRTDDGSPTNRSICSAAGGSLGTRLQASAGSTSAANTPRLSARRLDADSTSQLDATTEAQGAYVMVLHTMAWASGEGKLWINGDLDATNATLTSSGSTSDTATNRLSIGAFSNTGASSSGTNFGDVDIAELIAGDGAIPDSDETEKLFGYLAHRWGLTDNLDVSHPYKTDPPTV